MSDKPGDREGTQNDKPTGQIGNTGKKTIRHFRDLDVYQNAFETGIRVYELSKKFPDSERYALTDQIRRSSRGDAEFKTVDDAYEHILGQLVRMIDHPEKWVIGRRMNT
jgi:hypothetical protein